MVGMTVINEQLEPEWKIPFTLAVGLHFLVLVTAIVAPMITNRKPVLPEVYTVNLFSASEIGTPRVEIPKKPAAEPAPAPVPAPATVQIPVPQPVPAPEPAPLPEPPQIEPQKAKAPAPQEVQPKPEPAPAPVQKNPPISLQPLKSKKKEDKVVKDIDITKALQRIQAKVEVKEAQQKADRAVNRAVSSLRQVLHSLSARQSPAETATQGTATSAAAGRTGEGASAGRTGDGAAVIDEILKRYYASVFERIQGNWNLPDLQTWKSSLETVVVLEIRKDGVITNQFYEKESENPVFNQFVDKAIQESIPLPPFPMGLDMDNLEIGLRFKPGELL